MSEPYAFPGTDKIWYMEMNAPITIEGAWIHDDSGTRTI